MASGIIPGVKRRKRGHFALVGPITPRRIATINERILKFRCKPGRKKLRKVPPIQDESRDLTNLRFSRLNLNGILVEFAWWMNQSDPLKTWTTSKKREVFRELIPAIAVGVRLSHELGEPLPKWDGTMEHLRRLAW
jgi:hypothetical protein